MGIDKELYFMPIRDIPAHLMSHNRFGRLEQYTFKMEVYKWCLKNKIHYKTKKYKPCGFVFKNKEEAMAMKLKWW